MAQAVPRQEQASISLAQNNVLVINSSTSSTSQTTDQNPAQQQILAQSQNGATIITGGVPATAWDSSAAELSTLLIGKQLGSYLIEDSLGLGGMAAVFRARDLHLERRVALKVLLPRLAANKEHVQRFEREARLAAQLDSEHIARVHSYGQDQGLHYIAYEYIEGTNLNLLLQQAGGKLPIQQAIDYVAQAAQGIHDAASQGITHRDIKPSNMIVTSQGKLKLLDLGLARHLDLLEDNTLTHPGSTLGTFDYLSPEQAIDPRLADVRSDIYSLGCTFYQMLTGMPPVPEGTAARKLHSHQLELPRDPRELNRDISQELVIICSRMLAKNPEDRYQTASELLADLNQIRTVQVARQEVSRPTQEHYISTAKVLFVLLIMLAGIFVYDQWSADITDSLNGSEKLNPDISQYTTESPASTKLASKNSSEPAVQTAMSFEVADDAEFRKALQHEAGGIILIKTSVIENKGLQPWLVNKKWTIKPLNTGLATLKLAKTASHPLFTLEQGTLNLENIKVEIVGTDSIAFQAQEDSTVTLSHCELIRKDTNAFSSDRKLRPFFRFESSKVGTDRIASLELRNTYWHPGPANGIEFAASGQILIEDCAIGAQHQWMMLAASNSAKRIIHLKNTSLAVARSSTFAINDSHQTILELDQCTVGIQEASINSGSASPTFLQVNKSNSVAFSSRNTVYYGINSYCTLGNPGNSPEMVARNLQQLESCLQQFRDDGSLIARRSPWVETNPWQKFSETASSNSFLVQADFQLKGQRPDAMPTKESASLSNTNTSKTKLRSPRIVTIDGIGIEPAHYSSIQQALHAHADESELTLLLQINGNVPMNTVEIGDRKVIIKGDEGYRPELSLQRSMFGNGDDESSLFRIRHGELSFEFIRVRLESTRDNQKLLSLVNISGEGRCIFRNSVVTLRANSSNNISVIAIDNTSFSRTSSNNDSANGIRIECIDSIIRGKGQVIHTYLNRPWTAAFSQTAIAIDGSLVTLFNKQTESVASMEISTIQLDRCTSYTTRGLIWMRDSSSFPNGPAIRCQCSHSVLANSDAQPLIRLETKQNESELKRQFQWVGKRNYYLTGTGVLLSYLQLERDTMPTLYDSTLWSETWAQSDEQAQHIKSVPLQGIIRQTAFSDWEASDFLLKLDGNISIGLRDIGFPAETMPRETMPMP